MIPFLYSIDGRYENFNSAYNSFLYVFPPIQQNFYMFPCNNSIQKHSVFCDRTVIDNIVHSFPAENAQELHTLPMGEISITVQKKQKRQRKRNVEKQVVSAKKNSESNIVNQLYSFYSNLQLSQKVILRVIRSIKTDSAQIEKICSFFYKIVRLIIFKKGKRYVNKDTIMKHFSVDSFKNQIPNIEEILREQGIDLEDLCKIFRISSYHFINHYSTSAIMTSRRISMTSKYQHLKRRRVIMQSMSKAGKN